MPIEYSYDSELNAVVTRSYGCVRKDDVLAHLSRLTEDPAVPHGFVEVVDVNEATDVTISFTDAHEIVLETQKLIDTKAYRGALFYAQQDSAFGIGRMFQMLLEQQGLRAHVFRGWDEIVSAIKDWVDSDSE